MTISGKIPNTKSGVIVKMAMSLSRETFSFKKNDLFLGLPAKVGVCNLRNNNSSILKYLDLHKALTLNTPEND